MSFRENLHQKIRVDRLSRTVIQSIGAVSGGYHVDKDDMRALLTMAGYEAVTRRHLEMYSRDFSREKSRIIVLDNELKAYHTSVDDVLVRKEPFLGEMVKLKNIRKILNDSDVVVSSRETTVQAIRREILEALDLSYTDADIEALRREGSDALAQGITEKMMEILELFAEILDLYPPYTPTPGDLVVYGYRRESGEDFTFGPVYLYNLSQNTLQYYDLALSATDSKSPKTYKELAYGKTDPEMEGDPVLDDLKEKALAIPGKKIPIE